jgi:hypothetical protein
VTEAELRELAVQYATLERIKITTEEQQARIATTLFSVLPRGGLTLNDGTLLVACSSVRRRASLGGIRTFFGEERADAYWQSVVPRVSTWISVVFRRTNDPPRDAGAASPQG